MKRKYFVLGCLGIAALIIGAVWWSIQPGQLDEFAQCLKDRGATFYGAFWCPHCQAQKRLFGRSAHVVPYVECSTPNGQAQTQQCIDKQIKGYPTWEFKDASRLTGEISLKNLAERTGCVLRVKE